jgi:hypothetical protein
MNTAAPTRITCALATLLLAACSTLDVFSDQYPEADLSGYRSFAWIAEDPLIRAPDTPQVNPLAARRIREAIASELQRKGYREAGTPGEASFVVAYTVGLRDRLDPDAYPLPYRGPWLWESYKERTDLHVYQEGTLAIDIFDGVTRQPVWHGRLSGEVTHADLADPGPAIQRAVVGILRRFPSR